MSLVFDSSVIFELEHGNKEFIEKIKECVYFNPDPAQISFMTFFEFYEGLRNRSKKNKERAIVFVNNFKMLEPSKNTAIIVSNLRHTYESKGINIQLADLIIASQVLENNMILVTRDKGFQKIEELNKIIL